VNIPYFRLWQFLLAPCALLIACGGSTRLSKAHQEDESIPLETCDFREQATAVWNDTVRKQLGLATKIVDGDYEAADAEKVTADLDQFTEDWISIRDWVCREYQNSKPRSLSDYDAKVNCLSRALNEQQAILVAIQSNESDVLPRLEELIGNLETCR